MHSSGPVGRYRQLVLVLEGELYLIPFALLKGSSSNEYLYERFSLISVPSLGSLGATVKVRKSGVSLNVPDYTPFSDLIFFHYRQWSSITFLIIPKTL